MGLYRKESGGFLAGETATIVGLRIDSKDWDGYSNMSVELLIKRDEADEPVKQFLPAGFIYPDRGESISDDGQTLEGGAGIGRKSEFGRFLETLVEARAEFEDEFPEDGSNFSALIGWRVTFGKEKNPERQMAAGFKKLGVEKKAQKKAPYVGKGGKTYTEAQVMEAGKRPDANDKTKAYDHDRLIIQDVIEKVEVKGAKKSAAKATSTAAKGGKSNGAAKEETDYKAADKFLLGLLTDAKDNKIPVKSINSLIVKASLETDMEDDVRDGFRAMLTDPVYLQRANGWEFDGKVISLG